MNKLWLIIQREYLVRVRKKSFIIATILMPVVLILMMVLPTIIATSSGGEQRIIYIDDSGYFESIPTASNVHFIKDERSKDELRRVYKEEGFSGVLYIPEFKSLKHDLKVEYYSDKQMSAMTGGRIENRLEKRIRTKKMEQAGLSQKQLDELDTNIELTEFKESFNEEGDLEQSGSEGNAEIASFIGLMMGMFMYMILIIYGAMIMRSVQEEKINRIVEVMISSVKPFQLMLGKIIGVAGVGLTQILIWVVLIVVFQTFALPFVMGDAVDPSMIEGMGEVDKEMAQSKAEEIMQSVFSLDWGFIIPILIVFFLGGFLMYSSLFAAVGSSVGDDLGESQALMMPIMLPIIASIFIVISIINDPNNPIAVFGSIFPLFSPVVMPARLIFDPPWWEVALSIVLLLGSVLFFIWLSGKIYRVGIFMYGKKVTLKEIWKWLFYKP